MENVLYLFEEKYPGDDRPRRAVETCREWVKTGVFSMSVIREASLSSHAAARDAEKDSAAFYAARAAGQAAAAAHVAQHAWGVFYVLRAIAAAYPDTAEEKVREAYDRQAAQLPEHLREDFKKRVTVQKKRNRICITVLKDDNF